ncbi:HET-domain-containing protein, partial [Lepidopterella palustris CBS 459.81]
MPVRTINVGDRDNEPFLEIHDSTRNLSERNKSSDWATLSHCWGGLSPLTTELKTIEERRRAIPLRTMPKTFRDAVIITRELQIQHLWIDSLCIIQDSKEDWERQSVTMAEVYRHGLINIAATTSQHADDGILKPRSTRFQVPVQLKSTKHQINYKFNICPPLESFQTSIHGSGSVLRTRGWVLQESFLSPRTIHFGSEQMFWECTAETIGEGTMNPIPAYDNTISSLEWTSWDWLWNKRFLIPPLLLNCIRVWYNRWYRLVSNYSSRRLTVSDDIFPALSGLAVAFNVYLQDEYIAGLFWKDILLGLLWEKPSDEQAERATPSRAPTWSWASMKGRIGWP